MWMYANKFLRAMAWGRIQREKKIIACMMLMPGKVYSYKQVDKAVRVSRVNLDHLYYALCVGYPSPTTAVFYAALHLNKNENEVK